MAYFSNGTEGDDYYEKWCARCVHDHCAYGCPVWSAHQEWNYEECNKPDSILHKMIPEKGGGYNGQFAGECKQFVERVQEAGGERG